MWWKIGRSSTEFALLFHFAFRSHVTMCPWYLYTWAMKIYSVSFFLFKPPYHQYTFMYSHIRKSVIVLIFNMSLMKFISSKGTFLWRIGSLVVWMWLAGWYYCVAILICCLIFGCFEKMPGFCLFTLFFYAHTTFDRHRFDSDLWNEWISSISSCFQQSPMPSTLQECPRQCGAWRVQRAQGMYVPRRVQKVVSTLQTKSCPYNSASRPERRVWRWIQVARFKVHGKRMMDSLERPAC
jgi:hypothetical protein